MGAEAFVIEFVQVVADRNQKKLQFHKIEPSAYDSLVSDGVEIDSHFIFESFIDDDEYNECYLMVHSLDISGMSRDELEEKNLEYLDSLPRRPSKALTKLLKDRVKTQRGLAAATGLSEAKISRMCNEDDYEYSIQDVTRLIIGLQLPPLLSSLFLEMTRFTRTVMVRYYRYQCIIDCLFMEDIETVVESHKKLFDE